MAILCRKVAQVHWFAPFVDLANQREALDRLVLAYLDEFARIPERSIAERWTGYYPKLAGKSELVLTPMPGVTLVNALGGAGMTMSFGLAEEIAAVGAPLS